jgi:hypothetical protein
MKGTQCEQPFSSASWELLRRYWPLSAAVTSSAGNHNSKRGSDMRNRILHLIDKLSHGAAGAQITAW